jgi:ApbE superfamily uncharacterized protein (UPF0280 family)
MYEPRFYRSNLSEKWAYFRAVFKETDLLIGVNCSSFKPDFPQVVENWIKKLHAQVETYAKIDKSFYPALKPYPVGSAAPKIVKHMAAAARLAGVGPMAAVAGAIGEVIGYKLIQEMGVREVLVENGGDLFLHAQRDLTVAVYAGDSPFSNKIGLRLGRSELPLGVSTSAGRVGHALSFGQADAVVVKAKSASLADAYATSLGNLVKKAEDIKQVLDYARTLSMLLGVIIICEGKLGVWGEMTLVKI